MDWSPQQSEALEHIRDWHEDAKHDVADGAPTPVFRLFGFAGTGKTTLAKEMRSICTDVRYASFTGKAALVLRKKGCENATTIHSLIYRSLDKSSSERDRLKTELVRLEATGAPAAEVNKLRDEVAHLNENLRQPAFTLNEHTFDRAWDDDEQRFRCLTPPDLICIDECSMVNERVGRDLESFRVPILVLGDPAQLPPVAGGGYFTDAEPNVLLTDIHRQAEGNPIIDLATMVRSGRPLTPGAYGESRIVQGRLPPEEWLEADQILVGRNETRHTINRRVRELRGHTDILPEPGEKLICLRNNHDVGLLNGSLWECLEAKDVHTDSDYFSLKVRNDDGEEVETTAHKKPFLGMDFEDMYERRLADEFDFGYAITVHKAQGSQWNNVFLMDEWFMRDTRQRWLYTGITRAAERITMVRR